MGLGLKSKSTIFMSFISIPKPLFVFTIQDGSPETTSELARGKSLATSNFTPGVCSSFINTGLLRCNGFAFRIMNEKLMSGLIAVIVRFFEFVLLNTTIYCMISYTNTISSFDLSQNLQNPFSSSFSGTSAVMMHAMSTKFVFEPKTRAGNDRPDITQEEEETLRAVQNGATARVGLFGVVTFRLP